MGCPPPDVDQLDISRLHSLPYPVYIGSGILSHPNIRQLICSHWSPTPSTIAVLIDAIVADVFPTTLNSLCDHLSERFRVICKRLEHDERSAESLKTREYKCTIEDYLFSNGCGRDTGIISIGGGAIGDLCGFVAATYMRGIPYIQIPTTLLAMVDASIGGKTAVNTPYGKNLIGAFHNPCIVLCDIDFLRLLPSRHISNGMSEVIKSGAIAHEELFEFCASNSRAIVVDRCPEALKHVIAGSLAIKANIVANDPKESGRRAILNFGHSVGHAIESLACGGILHGYAVSIGMVIEAGLSCSLGHCSSGVTERLRSCLQLYSLPTTIPLSMSADDILSRMLLDKKNINSTYQIIMLSKMGSVLEPVPVIAVDETMIRIAVASTLAINPMDKVTGRLAVPGSKSISNRVLILAALSKTPTTISGLLFSDDTLIMITALRALGVRIDIRSDDTIVVHGTAGVFTAPSSPIYLGNAGTAARFLTSLVVLMDRTSSVVLTGCDRMLERPISDLIDALTQTGVRIECIGKNKSGFPIRVYGGSFSGGIIRLRASLSSQFVSSLLMIAPFAEKDIKLVLTGEQVVSRPYIDMTLRLMKQFSVAVQKISDQDGDGYFIQSGQPYHCDDIVLVEGDASSATYPLAIAALTYGCVTVQNIGSDSLQGDANFCDVLRQMGCTVTQTKESSTVCRSSDQSLMSIDIDLSSMTDSFITLAVCAAVAEGTTFIRNIANQRVKECNRLAVVVRQLKKLGIDSGELPDGIWIKGRPELKSAPSAVMIDCFNDHRIAMSFAALSCRIGNIIIEGPNCVRKTYPEFWNHLASYLHVRCFVPKIPAIQPPKNTIILIGMRGVGKTTLGRIAASILKMKFIDMDEELERHSGCSLSEFVNTYGWGAFRSLELNLLIQYVCCDNAVIATGGGVVETPEAIDILQQHLTIEIRRELDDILSRKPPPNAAIPPGSLPTLWKKRCPLYESASRFQFPIKVADFEVALLGHRLSSFIKQILRPKDPLAGLTESFFVSLATSDVESVDLKRVSEQCDAVELRVDLLDRWEDPDRIRQQFATIKQSLPELPLIFTVRSRKQGGQGPDDVSTRLSLILLGVKLGVDYIDIEADLPYSHLMQIVQLIRPTNSTKIIGSIHSVDPVCVDYNRLFVDASLQGHADIVKVVTMPRSVTDSLRLMSARESFQRNAGRRLCIGICMGPYGSISRITNMIFSPVTHELLPNPAAPGQLTIKLLTEFRVSLGLIKANHFYLFGHPIDQSRSPAIHNAAFEFCRLPHSYLLHPASEINDQLAELVRSENFGGASVTIPLKESAHILVDRVTKTASDIGSINTIYRDPEDPSILVGDNTDINGITASLEPFLPFKNALVLGAGGTAKAVIYGLMKMGVDSDSILLYNRTECRGRQLANQYSIVFLPDLNDINIQDLDVIINTIPFTADFRIPASSPVLNLSPLLFDVNYVETAVLKQAKEQRWQTITGGNMLVEQAAAQFTLWTGRQAPKSIMHVAFGSNRSLAI